MTTRNPRSRPRQSKSQAIVWIDHSQAVIVGCAVAGPETVEILEREPAETAAAFDARAIEEVIDDDRVLVSGPAFARTEFEREYVSVTHRPDRIVDIEPTSGAPRSTRATA
jgi:hypothetical protein